MKAIEEFLRFSRPVLTAMNVKKLTLDLGSMTAVPILPSLYCVSI